TNGQSTALTITSIAFTGPFASTASTCPLSPSTLGAGAGCIVQVAFTPTALGAASGNLSFNDNAGNSPQVVILSGTGIAAATVTPTSQNFGNQAVGSTGGNKTFTLKNSETTGFTITSITASGPFSVQATTCPTSPTQLGAGKTC